jgi:hypothetical protein
MTIDTTADLVYELQQTLERASTRIRDPLEMRQARAEMNRLRDELRQRIGVVDAAVDLIRDARNQ